MSYKKELENATNFEECQKAYDRECKRKYDRLVKRTNSESVFTKMIVEDYSVWVKAQNRLNELSDFSETIKSRY